MLYEIEFETKYLEEAVKSLQDLYGNIIWGIDIGEVLQGIIAKGISDTAGVNVARKSSFIFLVNVIAIQEYSVRENVEKLRKIEGINVKNGCFLAIEGIRDNIQEAYNIQEGFCQAIEGNVEF